MLNNEIDDMKREIADLRKLVEAIAMGRATTCDKNGNMKPYDGPCVYEGRTRSPVLAGADPWCLAHGFNCPNLEVGR